MLYFIEFREYKLDPLKSNKSLSNQMTYFYPKPSSHSLIAVNRVDEIHVITLL